MSLLMRLKKAYIIHKYKLGNPPKLQKRMDGYGAAWATYKYHNSQLHIMRRKVDFFAQTGGSPEEVQGFRDAISDIESLEKIAPIRSVVCPGDKNEQ